MWTVLFKFCLAFGLSGLHRTVLRSLWSEVWSYWFLWGPKPHRITLTTIALPVPGPPESCKRLETSSKSWLLGGLRPLQRPPGLSNPFQRAPNPSNWPLPKSPQIPFPNHPKPVLRPSKPTSGPAAEGVALKIRRAAFSSSSAVPAAFGIMLPPTLRRRSAKYTSELVFS